MFEPGLGVSTASTSLTSFSVQDLVKSHLCERFSKCASNSVFSDVPNFSSVNYICKMPGYMDRGKNNNRFLKTKIIPEPLE